jgi:hypothetical protein
MGDPSHMIQVRRSRAVAAGECQWRPAVQGCVTAGGVVVRLELGKLPFQITRIPEQHVVEEFSAYCPDYALDERVRVRDQWYRLDFVNLKNPKVSLPPMRLEQRIVIRAEISRYALAVKNGEIVEENLFYDQVGFLRRIGVL